MEILPQKAECPGFELFTSQVEESFYIAATHFSPTKRTKNLKTCDSEYILQGLELPAAGLPHYQMPVRGRDGFEEILNLLASQIIDCFHAQTLIRTTTQLTQCAKTCVFGSDMYRTFGSIDRCSKCKYVLVATKKS